MGLLASVLKIDEARLLQLGQVETAPVVATAPLLPLNMLTPEMFERFVGDLASHLYPPPEATVRVLGARGHDQGGWDLLVMAGTRTIGIQCKRVERFGPAEAKRAITAADRPADRSILALSRVVSPATADVLKSAGWEIWDQDDISRKVRQLTGERQDNLIDIYFRGQRLALLGRDNPGPWVRLDRFFAPFDHIGSAFTHRWPLVGREADIAQLQAALERDHPVVILSAPGGMGKSRLLKAGVSAFADKHPETLVRFLSQVGEPDQASLEALGSGCKLLVVDDAHDRDGLPTLIDYVADPANQAMLLLATRPYAEQRIRNDLARFGIFDPATIALGLLPKAAMRALASEAISTFGAAPGWIESILQIAADNPLVAVMAARVVAEQPLSPELVRSADDLRKVVLARFTNVLTGRVGGPDDSRVLRDILGLIALLQPLSIDDREIGALLEAVTPHAASQATRALQLLIEGGILYKRGRHYRLMPDLLGDYLIDDTCIQTDNKLSLFAERVLKTVDDRMLPQVMVNLGRLDWRRHGGDPSDSRLLEVAWSRFRDIDHEWDPRIDAVRAVAIYQPAQALRFVGERLRSGKDFREAAKILENIAYTERYRDDALRLLWEMGRDDARDTGPHPSHPIRVLAELCELGQHKPLDFSKEVATFAFDLMDDSREWRHAQTPLAIVAPLLKGTIDRSRSAGRTITLSSAFVSYDYALPLRKAVVDRILALLEHPTPRIATTAARYLNDALRMPYGIGGMSPPEELRRSYEREFVATIDAAAALIAKGQLAAATMLAIASAVSWHADHGKGEPGAAADRLLSKLPTNLDFRLRAAMIDRARFAFRGQLASDEWEDDLQRRLPALAKELVDAWPDTDAILDQIEAAICDLNEAGTGHDSAHMLVDALVKDSLPLAHGLLSRAAHDRMSPLRGFVWTSMEQLLEHDPPAAHRLLVRYLDRDAGMAARAVPALGSLRRPLGESDLSLLKRAIMSKDVTVSRAGLSALHWLKDVPKSQIKALVLLAPFEGQPELLNDVAMHLLQRHRMLTSLLEPSEVEALLGRLRGIKSLEGHWVESLLGELAKKFPEPFADYLFDRTDRALTADGGEIDLLGYRFHEGKLGFHQSPHVANILDRSWAWLRQYDNADGYAAFRTAELVASMFDIDAEVVVEFLDTKLDGASPIELKRIAKLVSHTRHEFAFRHRRFVERFLDRCAAAGSDMLALAIGDLTAAALTGIKSGTLGEPMPRDLKARDDAKEVLNTLPRLSPAYPLYEAILADAERDIARSMREGEALDAEEEA